MPRGRKPGTKFGHYKPRKNIVPVETKEPEQEEKKQEAPITA